MVSMKKGLIPWKRKNGGLSRWEGGHPLEAFHRRVDELFDEFFEGFPHVESLGLPRFGTAMGDLSPSVEVAETDDEVLVTVELPGLDEKDLDLSLESNILTLRGEKRDEREEKKKGYYLSECSYGQFHRAIPLPAEVDEDKVSAKFKKGVLKVRLPKTEEARRQSRRIDVTAE